MAKGDEKIAMRYARALFELCKPEELDGINFALEMFVHLWEKHRELDETLHNPGFPLPKRLALLQEKANLVRPDDQVFANFLSVLLTNSRLKHIEVISQCFSRLVQEFRNILSLEVTSASHISDEEKVSIQQKIERDLPKEYAPLLSIVWKEDKKLLGGLLIKSGDKLLDASVKGSLEKMERELGL